MRLLRICWDAVMGMAGSSFHKDGSSWGLCAFLVCIGESRAAIRAPVVAVKAALISH